MQSQRCSLCHSSLQPGLPGGSLRLAPVISARRVVLCRAKGKQASIGAMYLQLVGRGASVWRAVNVADEVRMLCCLPGGKAGSGGTATDKLKKGIVPSQLGVFQAPKPSDADDAPSTLSPTVGLLSGASATMAKPVAVSPLKLAWRRVLKELSSLPRAIGLMALVAVLSGLGTFIPQNKVRTGRTGPILVVRRWR